MWKSDYFWKALMGESKSLILLFLFHVCCPWLIPIGWEIKSWPIILGFGILKKCAAKYFMSTGKLDQSVGEAIIKAADEVSRISSLNSRNMNVFFSSIQQNIVICRFYLLVNRFALKNSSSNSSNKWEFFWLARLTVSRSLGSKSFRLIIRFAFFPRIGLKFQSVYQRRSYVCNSI